MVDPIDTTTHRTTLPPMSGLAVTAFVFSLLFFLPLVPFIGVILGIVALISLRNGHKRGMGLAIASIPVGIATVFFMQGILAAIAIPAFINYMKRAKAAEATMTMDHLRQSAMELCAEGRTGDGEEQHGFLVANTDWTPSVPCQTDPRGQQACRLDTAAWRSSPWRELGMTESRHFQWRYESDGANLMIEARADLDQNGAFSSYQLRGECPEDGQSHFSPVTKTDELE